MDAYPEKQADDPALTGIVSMLMALAILAERASDRSLPVRSFVLWVLRMAEAAAREIVGDAAQASQETGPSFFRHGDSRVDCIRLALRLRALAQALAELPPQICPEPLPGFVRQIGSRLAATGIVAGGSPFRFHPAPAGRYPDTS